MEQKSTLIYKTLHDMTPDYLRSIFIYRDNISAYGVRNIDNNKFLHNLELIISREDLLYSGAQLWNNFPIDLRQASSLIDFKSKLRG